ncbi:uncharacterized protein LOC127079170 [Lathyrus oleraceus]|uniref:uncharacterized protein LOC127079170 n=1 Tax=Pisum sativum TaxID=3888 RepID=UPI0021CF50DE|nr:uncharacterized protein LOC127079170 [Pisum sativum]
MSRNHDASIKNLEMHIGQLSRQIAALPSSNGGFTSNIIDNPKNESCKDVETGFGVITKKGEAEIVKEDVIEKKEGGIEKEESGNQDDKGERGFTLDQLIDKNPPWRRTKKQILNDPNPEFPYYIKPPYPIIKKKLDQDDEAGMFVKFKEMLAKLQALLKGPKEKVVKEQIPHSLCDFGSSINVIPLNKVKELKVGEIISSNLTLTLDDSSITQPPGILRDVLVHVDGLLFSADFVVLDTKENSEGSIILRRPFLATGKEKIDVATSELILKFNKEKVVFEVYD